MITLRIALVHTFLYRGSRDTHVEVVSEKVALEGLQAGRYDIVISTEEPSHSFHFYRGFFFQKSTMLWVVATQPLEEKKGMLLQNYLEQSFCTPIALIGTPDDPRAMQNMEFAH